MCVTLSLLCTDLLVCLFATVGETCNSVSTGNNVRKVILCFSNNSAFRRRRTKCTKRPFDVFFFVCDSLVPFFRWKKDAKMNEIIILEASVTRLLSWRWRHHYHRRSFHVCCFCEKDLHRCCESSISCVVLRDEVTGIALALFVLALLF